jgi:alpha-beta hydrolase superfamily lysophospholipase
MAAVIPHARLFQLDLDDFSRDPAVVEAARQDPLVYQPGAPIRTARELINATERTGEHFEDITTPLLILHGTPDKLTASRGSEELYRRASSTDKTVKIYPTLAHDLIHEPEKEMVLREILEWVDARASKAP